MNRMYIYWNLQMPLRMKIGLCALTGGGIMYKQPLTSWTLHDG